MRKLKIFKSINSALIRPGMFITVDSANAQTRGKSIMCNIIMHVLIEEIHE